MLKKYLKNSATKKNNRGRSKKNKTKEKLKKAKNKKATHLISSSKHVFIVKIMTANP